MHEDDQELRAAFVDAYPRYVAGLLAGRGVPVDDIVADAIVEGTGVLDGLLTTLERTPLEDQRVSPLELFREALRPVDRALALVGAPEATDVGGAQAAWDRFGLAPGSSQVLGPRAHEAHLAWGVRKASVMTPRVVRPTVVVMTNADRHDRIAPRLEAAGYEFPTEEGQRVSVALIDVGLGGIAHEAIRRWASSGARVVAFGDDVDDLATEGLRALGASRVVTTDVLLEDPAAHLPTIT